MEHLKPGGWFEQVEISVVPKNEDGSLAGTSLEKWGPLAIECGEKFGKSFTLAEDSRAFMEKAGFVNVEYKTFKWLIGPWPRDRKMKEIGAYHRLGWDEGINGWAMFLFTKYLGVRCLPSCLREGILTPFLVATGRDPSAVCPNKEGPTE